MVIDLKTGEVWGFPTIYTVNNKPPVAKPAYLGRFDFSAMLTERLRGGITA